MNTNHFSFLIPESSQKTRRVPTITTTSNLYNANFLYLDKMSSIQFYAYSAKYVCNLTRAAYFCFVLFGNWNMVTSFPLMYS
jgi:hypothetical protein